MHRGFLGALLLVWVTGCAGSEETTRPRPAVEEPDETASETEGDDDPAAPASPPAGSSNEIADPPVANPATPPSGQLRCDPKKPFGAAKLAAGVNAKTSTSAARLSSDELSVFFTRAETKNSIFTATRADRMAAWSEPTLVAPVSGANAEDGSPSITQDGLTMYLHSNRTPTLGTYDIWVARRKTAADAWGAPAAVKALSSAQRDTDPFVRSDGRMIVFASNRTGNSEIFKAYVDEAGGVGAPARLAELGTDADETNPVLSADGLAIYFARRGVSQDVYVARRTALNQKFGAPTRVDELTTPADERPSWVSPDECVLWFSAVGRGTGSTVSELYIAERPM